jgi:hypothetical protein
MNNGKETKRADKLDAHRQLDGAVSGTAYCPKAGCNGIDKCYFVDDYTTHKCDTCGTKWGTYDPQNRVEQAINIEESR